MTNPKKLGNYVRKKSIRAEERLDYQLMPVLGVSNKLGITKTDHKKSQDLSNYLVIDSNDFAYNPYRINVGSIGLVMQNISGLVSPAYVVFTTTDQLLPEILLDFLKSKEGLFQIKKYAKGTVRKALRYEDLCEIEMPIPSIEQQREILEKKENVKLEVIGLQSEINLQKTYLKKLQQQILQDAIEGKLSIRWREENSDVEPAKELLKKILLEKDRLVKNGKISKQKSLPPINDTEKPFKISKNWQWCRLNQIIYESPKNGYSPKAVEFATTTKTLKLGATTKGIFDSNEFKYIDEKIDSSSHLWLKNGDILIQRSNSMDHVGVSAIFNGVDGSFIYPDLMMKIKVSDKISTKYIHAVLMSPYCREYFRSKATGAQKSMPKINQLTVSSAPIPLPPVLEQEEIVRKIEILSSICEEIEAKVLKNQFYSDMLMQSILREAFASNEVINNKNDSESALNNLTAVDAVQNKKIYFYRRTLLAAEIVHQLSEQPTLGHLKLQKIVYLCQKTLNLQLPTNFLQQAAGPYDPEMQRSLDREFEEREWFSYSPNSRQKYKRLKKAGDHKDDFALYFEKSLVGIGSLISLFKTKKSNELEAVATLYACWEGIIHSGRKISNPVLIEKFYQWSDEKRKFSKQQLHQVIAWMVKNQIVPRAENAPLKLPLE